jgi:hypothetical protein
MTSYHITLENHIYDLISDYSWDPHIWPHITLYLFIAYLDFKINYDCDIIVWIPARVSQDRDKHLGPGISQIPNLAHLTNTRLHLWPTLETSYQITLHTHIYDLISDYTWDQNIWPHIKLHKRPTYMTLCQIILVYSISSFQNQLWFWQYSLNTS